MADRRSWEIKRILRKAFPGAKFRVRIEKYSGGESIHVKTDLYPYYTQKEGDIWYRSRTGQKVSIEEWEWAEQREKQRREVQEKIEELLRDYYHVHRDQWGEILSGGNTYLFIEALEREEL